MVEFGLTISGEWSLAINDCGQYLNDVGNGSPYEGTWLDPYTGVGRALHCDSGLKFD